MTGRRVLHQRTASETNSSSNNSRTSSLVSQRIKRFETIVSGSSGSNKSNSPKAPINKGSDEKESTPSNEKENITSNEKSDASSTHTDASVATFGSLPPVPPLRINKLLPAIEPLKVHRQTQSQDSHSFDYPQASGSRPGSYQQPIYRDSFQSQEPTTNAPHTPNQLLSPFSPQAPASPSPSQASNSSLRPLLPLKPILKKPKDPLPPYSVEDYKQRRNSWVRSTFSNSSQRELQHMRSLRLVNEDMDEARIGSDISSPQSAHHGSHSRYSSISGTTNSRPLSSRLSAGLQEWGSTRNSATNSANSRSARSSSFGLQSNASTPTVGPSFYPAWARKYYGSGEKAFLDITEEDEKPRTPRIGRRALSEDDAEMRISEIRLDPRRATYPGYRPETQGTDESQWSYPHLERPPPAKTEYFRPQLAFFIVGFLIPVAWFIGAFWPLSPRPNVVPQAGGQVDVELAVFASADDERKYENARWWRNVNRSMSVVGLLLIGGIIALAILATKP